MKNKKENFGVFLFLLIIFLIGVAFGAIYMSLEPTKTEYVWIFKLEAIDHILEYHEVDQCIYTRGGEFTFYPEYKLIPDGGFAKYPVFSESAMSWYVGKFKGEK